MSIVVNCFGGPGAGKSTLATRLYSAFKMEHYDVEYVNEFAKELVYENNTEALSNQVLVFGTQLQRLKMASNNNLMVICDSPILLSAIYNPDTSKHLIELVIEMHMKFNNFNIMINRGAQPHTMSGRIHSLTQSITIDNQIIYLMKDRGIKYTTHTPGVDKLDTLIMQIKAHG